MIQGRILHVKCRLPQKSLNVINVYQHTENATAQTKAPMQTRATLWKTLDGLLDTLAFRNLLVLGGDFNCPLRGHGPPPVCPLVTSKNSKACGLIKKSMLHTARTHDSGPTFIGSQGNSTIDFLFFRKIQMDSLAHHGKCMQEFPLASWRELLDHRSITGSP